MPILHSIQPTFSGGEFAPTLYSRVDLQKYATGLKKALNWIVHPHGGVSNRPGTRLVAEAKYATRKCRIVAFEFSVTQAYALEIGHQYIRIHVEGGTLLETAKTITGATQASPVVITATSHGYNAGDQVVIAGVAGMTNLNNKTYQVASPTTNTFQLVDPATGAAINGSGFPAYTSGGTVARIYEIPTTYQESDLPLLKFTQSADTLYLVHPLYPPQTLVRTSDVPPVWVLSPFVFDNGPFMLSNIDTSKTLTPSGQTGNITLTSSFSLFQAGHVGALFQLVHQIPGQNMSQAFTAAASSSALSCGNNGTWRIITHGNWGGQLRVEQSPDGVNGWTLVRTFSSGWNASPPTGSSNGDFNANTFGTISDATFLRVTMTNLPGDVVHGTCNVDFSVDPYEATGVVEITAVASGTSASATVTSQIGSTSATHDWAEGSWSSVRGYPSAVIFYQDRLGFAGTTTEPQTTWMSKSGAYTDFGVSSPLVDSDAISVVLSSRKMNGIKTMVGLRDIVALTAATEWSIGPVDGTVLSPTSVQQYTQGYRGSNGVDPVIIGNRIVYVQPMGSIVRDMGFDFSVNGYHGDDLSVYANHLFTGYSIVEMAYQQEPDSLIWCVRNDGTLLCCTYVREQDVLAWTPHTTSGTFESVCCIPAAGYDELWLVVQRNGRRFVERMAQQSAIQQAPAPDPKLQFYVDCGVSYNSPVAITGISSATTAVVTAPGHGFSNGDLVDLSDVDGLTKPQVDPFGQPGNTSVVNGIRFKVAGVTTNTYQLTDAHTGAPIDTSAFTGTVSDNQTFCEYLSGGNVRKAVSTLAGLDHLNGQTVSILADGSVQPPQVVSNGQITLSPAAAICHAGLGYTSDLQTLSVEFRMMDGTLQDRYLKIPVVTFRFLNSRGGFIGPSASDLSGLDELVQRSTEPLGSPIALQTIDYRHQLSSSYVRGTDAGSVFFRQADPLPVTILAIIPQVDMGAA